MAESYTSLPTSHLLGSVPEVAVVVEDERNTNTIDYVGMSSCCQSAKFSTKYRRSRGNGYQNIGSTSARGGQPSTNWQGVFSISSYTQYFNVDTDIVLNRLLSSLNPVKGDFFSKIDVNPDFL
ncbi:hypothetical protein AKJ16_DCAP20608 [Drosera capensis]